MLMELLVVGGNIIPYFIITMLMYTASTLAEIGWAGLGVTVWTSIICGVKVILEIVRLVMGINDGGFTWGLLGMCFARSLAFSFAIIVLVVLNLGILLRMNINRILGIILNLAIIGALVWFLPIVRLF